MIVLRANLVANISITTYSLRRMLLFYTYNFWKTLTCQQKPLRAKRGWWWRSHNRIITRVSLTRKRVYLAYRNIDLHLYTEIHLHLLRILAVQQDVLGWAGWCGLEVGTFALYLLCNIMLMSITCTPSGIVACRACTSCHRHIYSSLCSVRDCGQKVCAPMRRSHPPMHERVGRFMWRICVCLGARTTTNHSGQSHADAHQSCVTDPAHMTLIFIWNKYTCLFVPEPGQRRDTLPPVSLSVLFTRTYRNLSTRIRRALFSACLNVM